MYMTSCILLAEIHGSQIYKFYYVFVLGARFPAARARPPAGAADADDDAGREGLVMRAFFSGLFVGGALGDRPLPLPLPVPPRPPPPPRACWRTGVDEDDFRSFVVRIVVLTRDSYMFVAGHIIVP